MMTLTDQCTAVNAYADYLATLAAAGQQFSGRDTQGIRLRNAALAVLEAAQDWPEVSRHDGQQIVLEAPDGTHVLYTSTASVERLTIVAE